MPDFQVTLFLTDTEGTYGWSEPYYIEATTIEVGVPAMEALITERSLVLTDFNKIVAGRISDTAVLNDSLLATNTPLDGAIVSTSITAVDPWTALMMRVESTSAHRGRHFFHGVLENTFLADRSYDPANPNNATWVDWKDYLVTNTKLRYKLAGVPTYGTLTGAILQRMVEKKVGRPFGLLRGRRPT